MIVYPQSKSLPLPHGNCSTKPFDMYKNARYTYSRCQLECVTTDMAKVCGCKDAYMPGMYVWTYIDNLHMCVFEKK